jgi:hypothetical protein
MFNYLEITYVRKENVFKLNHEHPEHIIEDKKVHLGVSGSRSLENLKENATSAEIVHFYSKCISFYIELVTQIKKKIDFSDPIYDIKAVVDPQEVQSFNIKSHSHVLNRFPTLKDVVNVQDVDNATRTLR